MNNSSLFESDFIERTYPSIVSDISTAFAELVANAWDAGATRVDITIPTKNGEKIIISDNGSGMTDEEFRSRWMVMAYNRVDHQGDYIDFFIDEKTKIRRVAYGRNGVGRHSLICFNDFYSIETWKDGVLNHYDISATGGSSAFSIDKYSASPKEGSGTIITVEAVKKFPDSNAIINTLGYKFIFDPMFKIYVNGMKVEFQNSFKPDKVESIHTTYGDIILEIYQIPEGEKTTTNNGIAIWVNKRLVGKPSWVIGDKKVEDARRKFALKHVVIVKADYLIDDITYDWSGFRKIQKVLDSYVVLAIQKTNEEICKLFDAFLTFLEDVLSARTAYTELLEKYIHRKRKFLGDSETAECFTRYLRATKKKNGAERVASSSSMRMSYEVFRLPDGAERLCETYEFDSLGAFLYVDFFRGLGRCHVPKRCDNCGQYFLLSAGKYSSYCERPLKDEPDKTCREVGARKRYDDKCKTDPVWLAYNRAYKAHYARYMKKKMTTAQFEQWSRYAVELRDKAEQEALPQAEYERLLKI